MEFIASFGPYLASFGAQILGDQSKTVISTIKEATFREKKTVIFSSSAALLKNMVQQASDLAKTVIPSPGAARLMRIVEEASDFAPAIATDFDGALAVVDEAVRVMSEEDFSTFPVTGMSKAFCILVHSNVGAVYPAFELRKEIEETYNTAGIFRGKLSRWAFSESDHILEFKSNLDSNNYQRHLAVFITARRTEQEVKSWYCEVKKERANVRFIMIPDCIERVAV